MTDIDTGPLMAAVRRYAAAAWPHEPLGPEWLIQQIRADAQARLRDAEVAIEAEARELARRYAEERGERLRRAVAAIDLSDEWVHDTAEPGELVIVRRPIEVWHELLAALKEQT